MKPLYTPADIPTHIYQKPVIESHISSDGRCALAIVDNGATVIGYYASDAFLWQYVQTRFKDDPSRDDMIQAWVETFCPKK